MPDRIREMNNRFIEKVGIETNGNAFAKGQIIILDNRKEPYDVGTERADTVLLERTTEINDSINDVADAYQARIDNGCKTDLFWRLIGITTSASQGGGGPGPGGGPPGSGNAGVQTNYTLLCEQLNPAGYQPQGSYFPAPDPFVPLENQTFLYNPNKLYVMNQVTTPITKGGYTVLELDSKIGLTPTEGENFHGWKVFEEPYSEDLLDPILATGVGTISLASNVLTFDAYQPVDDAEPEIVGIKTGGLITLDGDGIFFDNQTSIVSYGTTIVGLGTTTVAGVVTTLSSVRRTYVETSDFAMRDSTLPEADGTITNYFILQGPQDVNYNKLALKRDSEFSDELAPEIPTRVCPLTPSLIGKGVKIEYTNTGQPTACQEYNKFLVGQPDPANPITVQNDADFSYNIVEAPKVGPGKIWYRNGFYVAPINVNGGGRATAGTVAQINDVGGGPPIPGVPSGNPIIYENITQTCPDLDADIVEKENARDDLESDLSGDLLNRNSRLYKLYELTNALRSERNELNLRIWAFRLQMGSAEEQVDTWDRRLEIINDPDFYDLLQSPLTDNERSKFNSKKRRPTE